MIKQQKILVTGGLHGDEPTGIEVAQFFAKRRASISGLVCNNDAIKIGKRFIETDLNRSFNVNVPISLEEKHAAKLSNIVLKSDLIIDIHNTRAIGTTCAIVVNKPNELQLQLADYFGFEKIVVMPPSGSLISLKPESSISFEIAIDSMKKYSAKILIGKILGLKSEEESKDFNPELFIFVNKVLSSTLKRLRLNKKDFSNFKIINIKQKNEFGLGKGRYYPIFLKKEDEEVAFTLVKRIDVKYTK